jgi:hypothetical protein
MNCNGQPITPQMAESIELVNEYVRANQAYFQAYLTWCSLWVPQLQHYQSLTKGERDDNKGS